MAQQVDKSRKTLDSLNNDCLFEIIKKLSLKDRFRVRLNRRLRALVDNSLKLEKGLKIGNNANNCSDLRHLRHLLNSMKLIDKSIN